MNAFRNRGQRLTRVDIRAGGDPDCLKTRLCQHLIIVGVDSDAKLLILGVVVGPFGFAGVSTAHGNNLGPWDTVQQGVNMSLALRDVSGILIKVYRSNKPCGQGQRQQSEEAA